LNQNNTKQTQKEYDDDEKMGDRLYLAEKELVDDQPPVYEGAVIEEGDTTQDMKVIQDQLLKKEWLEEARQIPKEALNLGDAVLIDKTLKEEQLTNDELKRLEEILAQYRPALEKLQPEETMENLEDNIQLVEDEQEFLRLVSEYDTVETIHFNYKLHNQTFHLVFDVYPITDSVAVGNISENLSFFKDFSDDEMNVYNKIQDGKALTREELVIQATLNRKIERATQENQKDIIVEFLAMQLKFHNKDTTYEEMKQVLTHIHYGYLALLFNKVQEITNLGDVQVENVFQELD
jgi:hypothetical protein